MNKGIFFLLVTIGLCLSVALFNFLMDPYHVFLKSNALYFQIPREYININLKANKNIKNDTFLIGGSEVQTLFALSFQRPFFNKTAFNNFSFENQYYLLKNYLFLHPETKKVIIVVNYSTLLHEPGIDVSELKSKYYDLDEICFLLFSKTTTKYSIRVFRDLLSKWNAGSVANAVPYPNPKLYSDDVMVPPEDTTLSFEVHPEAFPNILIYRDNFRELYDPNIVYLEKMVNLLKERNIDYIFVIPPHHILYQTIIYQMPEMNKAIWDLKRLLVSLSDNDVYDFSIVNKDTTCDYYDNYYFHDIVHGNYILGAKMLEVLYYGLDDKNLYLRLNKKNVDKQLKYEDKLLKDYCNNNKKSLKEFNSFFQKSLTLDLEKTYRKKILNDKPEIFREIQFINSHLFIFKG